MFDKIIYTYMGSMLKSDSCSDEHDPDKAISREFLRPKQGVIEKVSKNDLEEGSYDHDNGKND